jgi:RNA polymerase sigma-70 factor (ECF subfamily)
LTDEYKNLPERELAIRAKQNDESAFGEIVRRYSPRVFRVASRFFPQYGLVEEAAQEIFLKAFVQIETFENRGSLEGWLTRIAVTTCLNIVRTNNKQPTLNFTDLTDDETAWLEDKITNVSVKDYKSEENKLIAADLLNRLFKTLSVEDALVLTLIDGEGESIKDVCEITGWSESKVKIRVFRARKRIRESLQKLLGKTASRLLQVGK